MHDRRPPMNTVSGRTRSQWDIFYRNCYNEIKGKTQESGGKSLEKVIICENTRGKENSGQDESSGTKVAKRTRKGVQKLAGSRNMEENEKQRMEEEKRHKVAMVSKGLRSKRELDMRSKNGGGDFGRRDDEVICLDEEVGSNGCSLKIGPESRSGSGSKLGSVDEVVSFSSKRVESTSMMNDEGKNSAVWGRERLQTKPLKKSKHDDVSIDLENSVGLEDSGTNSDGSDKSVDSWVLASETSTENDTSDEDYNEGQPSGSDISDASRCCSDAEQEEGGEYDVDGTDIGNSPIKINCDQGEEDTANCIDDKKTFYSGRKNTIMNKKRESDIEEDKDDECNEGYHGNDDDDDSSFNDTPAGQKILDNEVIVIDDVEKFPSLRKSIRIRRKRDDGKTELHLHKLPPNYDCLDKTRKDGDRSTNFTAKSANKLENNVFIESGLRKRKVSGLDIPVDCDISNENEQGSVAKCLRSCTSSKSQERKLELGKFNSPVTVRESELTSSADGESESLIEEDGCNSKQMPRSQSPKEVAKFTMKKTFLARSLDVIKLLEDSIGALKETLSPTEWSAPAQINLPLKFSFEDEVQPPPELSEWEKEIDSLFRDLEMGLRESDIGCTNFSVSENDDISSTEIDMSPAACCRRGEHHHILDEQIGIKCKYCEEVLLEMKYVLPSFYTAPLSGRDRKEFGEPQRVIAGQSQLQDSAFGTPHFTIHTEGTVWNLMAGIEKELYPHQCEGFEFIWRNIAGDIKIEKLKSPHSDGARGCIISHAPGTGKTRLTIVFLLTFMKLYPNCRPVIVAPCGMLLSWEDEFIKWQVNIPFHNMNKKKLTGDETAAAASILGQVGGGGKNEEYIRLVKLYSWLKNGSILGISYRLFEKLAGENRGEKQNEQIKKVLLHSPGLLVLDEGHTARNNKSLVWKVLTKVATQRRVMLSGTPFQNNFTELYNTLCLVNPKFANHFESNKIQCEKHGQKSDVARRKWTNLTSSIGENADDGLKKLRAMLDPFVHVHKGSILQESLPGLRSTLVFLHPTDLQKTLLKTATQDRKIFCRIRSVSLVSVHPALVAGVKRFAIHKNELLKIESNLDAGVKTKFVMNLILLADALGERVLVFSQFIDPLIFLKKQLKSRFSWNEGKQVLYMNGNSCPKHRQECISSFNDHSSKAKVLFASQKACSEGINLIGASRVVLIDTVWNPSVERQAVSRAFRLGQKRVVYVYRLMTCGTEFRQYAQQAEKARISHLIFSPVIEDMSNNEKSCTVSEDKVLDALANLKNFSQSFAKIIHQPKESDLIEILKSLDID